MSIYQKCLICYSSARPSNKVPKNGEKINSQITSFFLTRRLFEISDFTCTNLLKDHGNPSNWFICCSICLTAVRNAQVVFKELQRIESKWKTSKSKLEDKLLENYKKQKGNKFSSTSEVIREEICKRLENKIRGRRAVTDNLNEGEFDLEIELKQENKEYENQSDVFEESTLCHMEEDNLSEISCTNNEDCSPKSENVHKSILKKTAYKTFNVSKKSTSYVTKSGRMTNKPKSAYIDDLPESSDYLQKDDNADNFDLNSSTENKTLTPRRQQISKTSTRRIKNHDNKLDSGVFICPLCGKNFTSKCHLTRHRQRIHFPNDPEEKLAPKFKYSVEVDKSLPENKNPEATVHCRSCEKTFDSVIQQYEHENATHGMKNQFICTSCESCFTTEAGLNIHFNRTHGGSWQKANEKSNGKLHCEYCGKFFGSPSSLKKHVESVHQNIRSFVCENCSKSFKQLRHLKFHQMRDHNIIFDDINLNELTCEYCGKIAASPNALKSHIQGIHEKKYTFFCSVCNVGRLSQSAMDEHMLTSHSTERPEICSTCAKTFASKQSLAKHLKTHINQKACQCQYCDKSFFTTNSLKRHEELHKGQIYNCELCDKKFPSQHYLRNHHYQAHKIRKTHTASSQKAIDKDEKI